ncbi:hypothetical protein PMKS-003928 [Pichia membranifaciens]|uniref:Uncharacterized protein n=1 Tax=Pichia membranifaciens TaxID=4926 RepID=A0A1Q2YLI3_9ASCO|nr:hypothetical protein PMKS-003928 [Pichia membranifaciens]
MKLSLSVEETNRLRAQVGLKPIPVEKKSQSEKSGDTGILRISVEETNRLRKQLGLKLIPTGNTDDVEEENYAKLERQRRQAQNVDKVRAVLNEKKNELKVRQRMEKGGILDRIEKEAPAEKSAVLDFDLWLEQVGKEIKNERVKKLSFKKKEKPAKKLEKDREEKIVISHDKATFTEKADNEKEVILTLKDINVLDDGQETFENRQLKREESLKKALSEKKGAGKLVTLENANDGSPDSFLFADPESGKAEEPESKKRKLVSLRIESSDDENEEHDSGIAYDENGVEAKKISKFMKRDVSKFKKPKKKAAVDQIRTRVFETELVEKSFDPVRLDIDDDNEAENELEQALNATRRNTLNNKRFENAPEEDVKHEDNREVIDEGVEFIDNFWVQESQEEEDLPEANTKEKLVDSSKEEVILGNAASSRYKAILESEAENNYHTYGVSNVLNALKSGNKKLQGKDKTGDVEIVYTDDSGKVLNTKEAFKYLSHKFHGSQKR